jgi:hypothetical protein
MAGKNAAVFGMYPSITSVEIGVDELKAGGFCNTDISVLFPERAPRRETSHTRRIRKHRRAPRLAEAPE